LASINWTAEAETWLRNIYEYIAADNPDAARLTVEGIVLKAQLLKSYPQLGQKYEFPGPREIRILMYGHYRIAYLVKPDNNIDIWECFMAP
jgi:plasmid stabilization system protein ParE